jgi:hypothetical protein
MKKIAKFIAAGYDGKTIEKIPYHQMETEIKKVAKDVLDREVVSIVWNKSFKNNAIEFKYFFIAKDSGTKLDSDGKIEINLSSQGLERDVLI